MFKNRPPRLGQHFLADDRFQRRIADSLDVRADDLLIEIGAGRGAMTRLLAGRAHRMVAIELDGALAGPLRQKFADDFRVEILHADILSVDLAAICKEHEVGCCFVFGNLPYYITSPILERMRNFRAVIRGMAFLMQREVAERVVAVPGSRDYGVLSVSTQLISQPRVVFGVPPGAFSPPPKVHSALVEFQMNPLFPGMTPKVEERFLNFVKRCFARKRKNLINNLSSIATRGGVERELERMGLPPNLRAEQVAIEDLADLFNRLEAGRITTCP